MDLQGVIDMVRERVNGGTTYRPPAAPAQPTTGFTLGQPGGLKTPQRPGFRMGASSGLETPFNPRNVPAVRPANLPAVITPQTAPRVPGAGIEGMGDFAPELAGGTRQGVGIGSRLVGGLRTVGRALTHPLVTAAAVLEPLAGMTAAASQESGLGYQQGTNKTAGSSTSWSAPVSTMGISNRNPFTGATNVNTVATPGGYAPAQRPLMMAHSPGQTIAPSQPAQAAVPTAAPAAPRGLRRATSPTVARGNPADPPQGFGETPAPRVTAPLITENTDAEGVLPASVASQVPITAANGGFGFTRNDDGTVGEMYTLRARTPEEDAAYAAREKMAPQNQGITTDRYGVPYGAVDTSPGTHAAWVQEQQLDSILNRPLGLKLAAHMVNQQNANTVAAHYGTEDMKTRTLLPGEVATQASGLQTAAAQRSALDAGTGKTLLETQLLPVTTQADLGLKAAQAKQASQHGDYYSTQGAVKDAQVANLSEKLASAEKIASEKDATAKEKIAAASESTELKTLAAADPGFTAKYTAVGGKVGNYKAAEEIAALKGLEFKPKPFKTGVIGMRTTHPAGWYTADGQPYRMNEAVAEHLKRKGGQ